MTLQDILIVAQGFLCVPWIKQKSNYYSLLTEEGIHKNNNIWAILIRRRCKNQKRHQPHLLIKASVHGAGRAAGREDLAARGAGLGRGGTEQAEGAWAQRQQGDVQVTDL